MAVVVLFGSETGTAEEVADKIADVLSDHDAEVRDMLEYEVSDIDTDDFHVVVCSTKGEKWQGEDCVLGVDVFLGKTHVGA